MKYLLDSNIIISLVTNGNAGVIRRAAECDEGDIVTSSIAFAEVAYGSFQERPPEVDMLRAFVEEVPVLDFDYKAALVYAGLPFRRARFDRLIAAHALSHGLTLVSHNIRDFADIPELTVESWIE